MQITTQLTTYEIKVKQMTRTAYPETGGTAKVEYTQYNILDGGQLVGFVFDENDIEAAINGIENPGRRPYGTRFDRTPFQTQP